MTCFIKFYVSEKIMEYATNIVAKEKTFSFLQEFFANLLQLSRNLDSSTSCEQKGASMHFCFGCLN